MPLYEYECAKCAHRFEKIENFSAPTVKKCPKCGGKAERQLSRSAIQFKGSGWYVTDYAGKKADSSAAESSGDGAAKEKGKEKAGETKSPEPAKATESSKPPSDKATSKKKK